MSKSVTINRPSPQATPPAESKPAESLVIPEGPKAPEVKAETKPAETMTPAPEAKPTETKPEAKPVETTPPATKAPLTEDAISKYTTEVQQNGQLSEESLKEIETNNGIPKAIAVQYVQGQVAQAQLFQQTVQNAAGGAEQYKAMQTWAATNLNAAEKSEVNAALQSNDPNKAALAVKGVYARFVATHGTDPQLAGGTRGPSGPQPFASQYEIQQAMADPRYGKDDAYRRNVIERLAVTK